MAKVTKKKAEAQAAPVAAPAPKIIAYKGFDKDFKCRGFQFEVGKTYTQTGEIKACSNGFHACIEPIDVLAHYNHESRYAIVEISGKTDSEPNKIAAECILVVREISLAEFIDCAVKSLATKAPADETASGYYSTQAASGDSSKQAASGDSSKQAASGNYSTQAASGYYSTQAASGYSSTQAASGYYSTQAASGDSSKQAASGNYSKQELTGKNGVAMSAGKDSKAKASEGGCFALRWDDADRPRIVVGYVGENGIKADTWYTVSEAGEIVEVQS